MNFEGWYCDDCKRELAINKNKSFTVTKSGDKYRVDFKINQQLVAARNYLNTPLEIGFLDTDWKIHKMAIPFNGKSETKGGALAFEPLMLLIDPDEKIADATTDEYRIIRKKEQIGFTEEFFDLDVKQLSDSVFFRITHHWISPANKSTKSSKYEMANRYWQVQYVANGGFKASAKLKFDQSYMLDDNLKNFRKENIHLMYRKNPLSEWKEIEATAIKQGNKGWFLLNDIKNGEYMVAGKR